MLRHKHWGKQQKNTFFFEKQRSTSPAFNPRSDAHIIQHSPKPSNLHLPSHMKAFSDGGECALPKGQIGHNPYTHK